MAGTGLVLDDRFLLHDTGAGHPERAERLVAIRDSLYKTGLVGKCTIIEPEKIDWSLLLRSIDFQEWLALVTCLWLGV